MVVVVEGRNRDSQDVSARQPMLHTERKTERGDCRITCTDSYNKSNQIVSMQRVCASGLAVELRLR
jgi:hypothetical protein